MKLSKILKQNILEPGRFFKACGLSPFAWRRIKNLPRYQKGQVSLWESDWEFVDARTLLAGLKEIYLDKCLQFNAKNDAPRIIDCGANIGLSVLYFKKLYPQAEITAFEADPIIFATLAKNIKGAKLSGVKIINRAVWDSNETLEFRSGGGFSGRVRINQEPGDLISVKGARLKDYLKEKVDFLKIDIEGAEGRVLKDCADKLTNVELIFFEYHSPLGEPQKLSEILKILNSAGYRYYLTEAYIPDNPFLGRPTLDGMDLQLNIYCIRN